MSLKDLTIDKIDLFGRRDISVFKNRPLSIGDFFANTVQKQGEKIALIYKEQQLTYKEFDDLTNNIASNLQMIHGINKNDRVLSLVGNVIEFPLLAIAIAKIGAIMVPINTKLKIEELEYIISNADPKLVIASKELADRIHKTKNSDLRSYLEKVLIVEESFQQLMKEPERSFTPVVIEETDPIFILYTSGTTGKPKGAILTHVNVVHSAMHYKDKFQLDSTYRTIVAVPFFHVTGLVAQLLATIFSEGSVVILEKYRNNDYIETSFKHQVNFHFNVPTIFIMMATSPLLDQYSFDFVKVVAFGGSTIYRQTLESLHQIFPNARLHNAYGATETTSPATIMPREYPLSKATSVGKAVLNGEIKIVKEDGTEAGVNEVGEILIKGPMVIPGYLKNDKANKQDFVDGFWKSGDMGKKDEDGFIFVLDRMKDMINRGGEKVFSIEVEDVLKSHPDIIEAAVVSIPDKVYGETVKAVLVSDTLTEKNREELKAFCSGKLAKFKVPECIVFVDELPKNASGKVLKAQL